MNKYVALLALGSVNACHMEEMSPLMGLLEKAPNCPKTNAPKLNHVQANRLFLKNVYSGFIKGWYSENEHVITDECFGHWMEPTFDTVWGLKKKAHEDFWSVGIDEVKDAGNSLVDTFYKNAEVCHFQRVQDDFKGWCIENPGQCIFGENMEERIFDNLFDILDQLFDIYKLSNVDDSCYSDLELMAEINRYFNDMGELMASLSGFDYKWDQSVERKHIKKKAFHAQIKDAIKNYQYKNVDPLELMFPDVAIFLKELQKGIDQFFKEMEESQKKMMESLKPHPHHMKHTAHHKNEHHQQQMQMDPFGLIFKSPMPTHSMFEPQAPNSDPIADMIKMMQPPQPHHPMPQWGMPAFEQPKFDMNQFKLF